MAFGGGFGGFGQNNNQQSTGFGFGQSTNTNTGFGASSNTGFGATQNNTGGGLFGASSTGFGNTGGFGNSGGAFGSTAKAPAFGSGTTGGGLFGSTTTPASTGFGGGGGFGASTNTGFGASSNTTGGLFGAPKPATGFGAPAATASPFGAPAATNAFGNSTGFGAAANQECNGTAQVPFQAFIEKESPASAAQVKYENIACMEHYKKWSPEELRLADYTQGRRQASGGQAGAFGQSTGFGGFGNTQSTTPAFGAASNTGGGLFGNAASNTTSNPFGQTTATNTGFGASNNAGGGLFGNTQKPATGGLFGSTTTGSTGFGAAAPSTGFGATTNTGFGSGAAATPSLFGNNTANKPSLFGSTPAASTGFGANTTSTGFGASTTTNPFGQPAQNTTSNPFGAASTTQPAATTNAFGGSGFGQNNTATNTGGLFGAPKPATGGLFGNTTTTPAATGGGLFGNNNTTTNTGFGAQPAASTTGGGLFGSKPAAPAATGGLFGNTTQPAAGTGSGSLFGNTGFGATQTAAQPASTGGLFGSLNNTQQQPKSLFGTTQPAQSGGLFGNNNAQQNTGGNSGGLFGSTFGNTQNQAQQQNTGGGLFSGGSSMFGATQQTAQQPQQQQQQQALTTSINDPAAFGSSMFSQLAAPDQTNPGPLATPLSSLNKQKKAGLLPLYKMSPQSGSRLNTPQKRGFGFSYSTYGTPGSLTSTPGTYSNSVLGTNRGQSMMKSVSTSNLRHSFHSSFNREDSILAPGAFTASPGSKYSNTGSMKKLVINRSIRGDLFTPPPKSLKSSENSPLKKRVSFESPETNGNSSASPLKQVQTTDASPSAQENGFLRSSTSTAAADSPKTNGAPEMEQVKGNELAIVPEEDTSATPTKIATSVNHKDKEPGNYWMSPSMDELKSMSRTKLQSVSNFTVGREGVGQIVFIPTVDLSRIDWDTFLGKKGVIDLDIRSATVYPEPSKKPPRGKELNVPAKITLENSWPRLDLSRNTPNKIARQLEKHIERLKRVQNATFIDYEVDTGSWTFRVEHFTTYGLNYDDEDDEDMTEADMEQADLTPRGLGEEAFDTPSYVSPTESERVDDTFDFKKRKVFPGAFDMSGAVEEDADMHDNYDNQEQSFLDERSAGSLSGDVDEPMDHNGTQGNELVRIESNDMAGSFPQTDATVELENQYADSDSEDDAEMAATRGGVSRAHNRSMLASGTPLKKKVQFAEVNDGDWASMLQQTISPMKRDRADLKRVREEEDEAVRSGSPLKPASTMRNRVVSEGHGFATSIDLMHSLFGESKSPKKVAKISDKQGLDDGFKWPYNKARKTVDENMEAQEQAYHDSVKPHWGIDGTLVYAAPDSAVQGSVPDEHNSLLSHTRIVNSDRDIRISKLANVSEAAALLHQKNITSVSASEVAPSASLTMPFKFKDFVTKNETGSLIATQENLVWELASILFDEIEIPDDLANFPAAFKFLRRDLLSTFWERLVESSTTQKMSLAKSQEEKAVAALAGHRIVDACKSLTAGKDFHLATLVALLDGNESTRESVQEQLEIWRGSRALSEINQPIRAIYEILAGNVCVCEGSKKGAPIEDRLDTFTISDRFSLDWRQAFGLRLWYASSNMGELKEAVRKYAEDVASERELAKPVAWYVEANVSPLWDDQYLEDRENLLWGLLKLYSDDSTDLQSVISPENSQLSPFNMRLTWQLGQALTASGKCSFGSNAEQKADSATLAFAQQLTAEGQWLDAIFVLLHLTDAEIRAKSVQDHLARHAGKIGASDSATFSTLVEKYKIPATWVWSAKALYMRAIVQDSQKEVECLIKAEAYSEAHRTLCKEVAPIAIIERDYDALKALLAGFDGNHSSITDWELGGGIYLDYLKLLEQQHLSHANPLAVQVAERLIKTLPVMVASARAPGFSEKIAAQEMSGVVAEVLVQHGRVKSDKTKASDHSKILRLPMTEDRYLKHTADLSLDYYRNLLMGTAH